MVAPRRVNAISLRGRTAGGGLVLAVVAAQTWWMGPAVIFLSAALVLAYGVWIAARWKNGAAHLVLSAAYRRYFPGVITAPVCLFAGIMLLTRLFAGRFNER